MTDKNKPRKEEVIEALNALVASLHDGPLTMTGVRKLNGHEIWDVVHSPRGENPIIAAAMGAVRRGSVKIYETTEGPAYELEIYGGREAIMRVGEGWALMRVDHHAPLTTLVADAMRRAVDEARPGFDLFRMGRVSDRAYLGYGRQSGAGEMTEVIVSLRPNGTEVENVLFQDEPGSAAPDR